jgi:hypothetical protein
MSDWLRAPFQWFGGKAKVASLVWERFGRVKNYVEPFFGSGAVLFGKPEGWDCLETINDKDDFICNIWRSIQADPKAVAQWADYPCVESDLHARHAWLVERKRDLRERLEGDPNYYDVQIAGWWLWGLCLWIGSGWCSGKGAWHVEEKDGIRKLVNNSESTMGISRQLLHLGDNGRGVLRKRLHLGQHGVGMGVHKMDARNEKLYEWFQALQNRLRHVRVCSGDWSRVCGPSVTFKHGLTGVFLDPPYSQEAERCEDLYREDCLNVANDVRAWCLENGSNELLRIALCGYAGEHEELEAHGWQVVAWKAPGGYGSQGGENVNATRERIWFSPHCLSDRQGKLF